MTLTQTEQSDCLCYPLFDGDFGSPGDKVLSNAIAVARKAGPCHNCAQLIQPGETMRRHVGRYDGEVRTYRYCLLCCKAMALNWTDGGDAICGRFALRTSTPTTTPEGTPA